MGMTIQVLVVEDNPLTTALLDVTFRRQAHMRALFCTGIADVAVQMARQQQPDVIVLDDLIAGDLDGPQLAPLLKRAAPRTRIVLFTGSSNRATAARTAEIDTSLDKLEFHELVPRIRQLAAHPDVGADRTPAVLFAA